MGDAVSQDDFDALRENMNETINGLTTQIVTLTDDLKELTDKVTELSAALDELKSSAADQKPKVDKMNQDLYETPKFISTEYKLMPDAATMTGILTDDTVLTNANLQQTIATAVLKRG